MIRPADPIRKTLAPRPPGFTLRWGLVSGGAAGVLMLLAALAIRFVWGVSSITELAADWFTLALPGRTVDWFLETLSVSAKPLMFAGLASAQLIAAALAGAGYARWATLRPASPVMEFMRALAFGTAAWLVSLVTLVPAFGGGFFATNVLGSSVTFVFSTLASFLVYGAVLGYMFASAGRADAAQEPGSRRAFLKRAAILAAIAVAGVYGVRWLFSQAGENMSSSSTHRVRGVLSSEVTPNELFYTVSKNFIDPDVRLSEWSLAIEGLVDKPRVFEFAELQAMPAVERHVTLECISNIVGGDLISSAFWKGVSLRTLLEEAQIAPEAQDVSLWASDGYSESISIDKLMQDEVLVVYEMNGLPLPRSHGFPARLIVPGYFGLKSVKWLTRIEPVDFNFTGYWQGRGWTDVPVVKTMSRIDTPPPSARVPLSPLEVGGIAFAGTRGISRVEIRTDDTDWTPVERISTPLGESTWVIWTTMLPPQEAGRVKLYVRAIDGEGNIQTEERTATIPTGATGHHNIDLAFERQGASLNPQQGPAIRGRF